MTNKLRERLLLYLSFSRELIMQALQEKTGERVMYEAWHKEVKDLLEIFDGLK